MRASKRPGYENSGELLRTLEKGGFFVSTGEVLRETAPGKLRAKAELRYKLPMHFAEVVWGDGEKTHPIWNTAARKVVR